jgi:glycosyltransferase involved in cell wall biosynthesis
MKILVVDQQLNPGGGTRFLLNLLLNLRQLDRGNAITLYCNLQQAQKHGIVAKLAEQGIETKWLETIRSFTKPRTIGSRAWEYVMRRTGRGKDTQEAYQTALQKEIGELSAGFDLAYFPWPFHLKCPETRCPKIGTFHDFNFKYFFGLPIFTDQQTAALDESIGNWLSDSTAVVSTHFMRDELLKFYPARDPVRVVHIASLNVYDMQEIGQQDLPVDFIRDGVPYFLLPAHLTVHKNLGNVVAALSLLNKNSVRARLVITGSGTDKIKGKSGYYGLERGSRPFDVTGLGYVTDEQMHFLIKHAFAVINPSLYEAGNGIGLDAWPMGTAVLQSDIPAFNEHLTLQGFKAFTFDPRCAASVAAAMEECIGDPAKRQRHIQESLSAGNAPSWEKAARGYLDIFKSVTHP